ncbi:MAG: sortase domain-bontaining protein [Marmoricola sp.]
MTVLDERPAPRTAVRHDPAEGGAPPKYVWDSWNVDVGRTFIVAALLIGWVFLYLSVLSSFEQGHAQRELYQRFRTELALTTAPTGAVVGTDKITGRATLTPIETGAPVAMISIPRVGIKNLMVVEGSGGQQLKSGPGHLRNTVLPGQIGTSEVLGKALSFGAPFGDLDQLRTGDPIKVVTQQGTFTFHVVGARHKGDPTPALSAGYGRLTLVTGVGHGLLSGLAPSDTVYFDADLAKAVGPGAVSSKVADEQPMKVQLGGGLLAELALAIQLLIAVFAGAYWARTRWSGPAAWIVGVPTILAALWLVSSLASQLLPNLV